MATTTQYVFDAAHETERQRLESLIKFFEPGTRRIISELGIKDGWRVLEVGGGTGTTTDWLCGMVGAGGSVVATDLDIRFLSDLQHPNVDVRCHDILTDSIEEDFYDLAHARLLLEWLPRPGDGLAQMIKAVKPGGWVLAEDFDFVSWGSFDPPYELGEKVKHAITTLFTQMGGNDGKQGLRLPRMFEAAGLVDVHAEGRSDCARGGSSGLEGLALMLEQLRAPLENSDLLTAEEIDQSLIDYRIESDRWGYSPILIAAWGRKPTF
jgi:SAM-dependent methyltransferase